MQQHLPLAVLKPSLYKHRPNASLVATAPTACGIETREAGVFAPETECWVATAPTACGIETYYDEIVFFKIYLVATAPTACGIETHTPHSIPYKALYGI